MIKKAILKLLLIISFAPVTFGQQTDSGIFVDSTGQVFVKTKKTVYFFIAPNNNPESRILIANNNPKSNTPMRFDVNGTHYIRTQDSETNSAVGFKIIADGIAPVVSIRFTKGLIMNFGTRFYVDEGATADLVGRDNLSGVRSIFYSVDGSSFSESRTITFDNGHDYLVKAYAIDNVGNISDTAHFRVISAVNSIIKINNIYFDIDSASLKPESKKELNEFVQVLKEYPEIRIELRAHTDSRGEAAYNLELSEKRAESVVNYLIENGINSNRLTFKGYGDTNPVNECSKGVNCSEEKHQENRRVEFKILPIK